MKISIRTVDFEAKYEAEDDQNYAGMVYKTSNYHKDDVGRYVGAEGGAFKPISGRGEQFPVGQVDGGIFALGRGPTTRPRPPRTPGSPRPSPGTSGEQVGAAPVRVQGEQVCPQGEQVRPQGRG